MEEELKKDIRFLKEKVEIMETWIRQANNVIHHLQEQIFDWQDQQINLMYLDEITCKLNSSKIK